MVPRSWQQVDRAAQGAAIAHHPIASPEPPHHALDGPASRKPETPGLTPFYPTTTGILPIFARHSAGPLLWTALPAESTATVTGMSCTSNS